MMRTFGAALVMLSFAGQAGAVIAVGALGDSYSDETMPAFGIPTWNEILVAGGRASFGPFANFPSGDPRNTGGRGSYTYNFAKGGATTSSALGSTQASPFVQNWRSQSGSLNRPDLWPGIRGAGTSGAIQFASQEIGGNDILSRINAGKLLAGLDMTEMNAILGRYEQILNIATVNYTSPLKMVLVTYPDLGSMPLFTGLPDASKLSIRANMDYFNTTVRDWAALKGMAVVELWNIWETAKTTPYTIHGVAIDTFAPGVGSPQDLNTMFPLRRPAPNADRSSAVGQRVHQGREYNLRRIHSTLVRKRNGHAEPAGSSSCATSKRRRRLLDRRAARTCARCLRLVRREYGRCPLSAIHMGPEWRRHVWRCRGRPPQPIVERLEQLGHRPGRPQRESASQRHLWRGDRFSCGEPLGGRPARRRQPRYVRQYLRH